MSIFQLIEGKGGEGREGSASGKAAGPARSIALIGLGKNVGKTTALNELVRQATVPLGLTSIGRDGELVDAITSHAKPPIRVPEGTVVATVTLPEVEGAFEVLEDTGERTAIGPVQIARALKPTQWELSGPPSTRGLSHIKDRLQHYGAEFVILDGAFDRRSSATPTLTDATILVTGAALDPDMKVVLAATAHLLRLFRLEKAELAPSEMQLLESRGLAIDGKTLDWRSALGKEEELGAAARGAKRILLGSTFTPQLVDALPQKKDLEIVVRDATSVLVDAPTLKRFRGALRVARPLRLPLVVCNPFSPYGWRYPARQFLEEVARVCAPLPVVDLVLGETLQCEPAPSF